MLHSFPHPVLGPRPVNLVAWKKQKADDRDHSYSIRVPSALSAVPPRVDLRPYCSPVIDQGSLGSCTACAFAALVEANENRRLQSPHSASPAYAAATAVNVSNISTSASGLVTFSVSVAPAPAPPPAPAPAPAPKLTRVSRLFEYYATRQIEGSVGTDSGASIRDAIGAGVQFGCIDEALWPYSIPQFATKPAPNLWTTASQHKVTSYHAINDGDIATMKSVLAAPIPFLIEFGFSVYSYFLSGQMAQSGLLARPAATESLQGGHAVVLVGYDDNIKMPDGSTGAFLVRNSWGTGWGYQGSGYFWMASNYVSDKSLCNDFWVVQSSPL